MKKLITILSLTSFVHVVNAKEVVNITATKLQEMPVGVVDSHSPNSVTFNRSFIDNKKYSPNAFSVVEGVSSVEYQQNVQDMGGHTGISINQLPFHYTSTFVDGIYIPDSSLDSSQVFSASAVQSIKINKGASSARTNPGSVAGSVEIETLNPLNNVSNAQSFIGSFGNYNHGVLASRKIGKHSGVLASFNTNGQNAIDNNKDNIAESPKLRNTFGTIAHAFEKDDVKIKTRVDFSDNYRRGGSMVNDKSSTTGNGFDLTKSKGISPDSWLDYDGHTETWNSGFAGLLEEIHNTRFGLLSSINTKNYTGGGVASILKRDNFYSGNKYQADETNLFFTLARKVDFASLKAKLGGDVQHQKLSSTIINADGIINNPDGYSYTTTSVFGQANYSANAIDSELSARGSYHNKYGLMPALRTKVNYHHAQNVISTISAGNAFQAPSSSFEQNHELITQALYNLERKVTKATQSFNASYNIGATYEKIQFNVGYNYNRIRNIAALMLHEHGSDVEAEFKTLGGYYKNQGIGFDLTYFATPTVLINIAGERYWNDMSKLEQGAVILSRPEYKLFTKVTKKHGDALFNLKATFVGRQNLEEFYGQVYNLSGAKNAKHSKEYLLLDFDASKNVNKNIRLFAGVENILNFVRINTSTQIATRTDSHSGDLDSINSWGPVRGRFFFVGISVGM